MNSRRVTFTRHAHDTVHNKSRQQHAKTLEINHWWTTVHKDWSACHFRLNYPLYHVIRWPKTTLHKKTKFCIYSISPRGQHSRRSSREEPNIAIGWCTFGWCNRNAGTQCNRTDLITQTVGRSHLQTIDCILGSVWSEWEAVWVARGVNDGTGWVQNGWLTLKRTSCFSWFGWSVAFSSDQRSDTSNGHNDNF